MPDPAAETSRQGHAAPSASGRAAAALEDVLVTERLAERPARVPDHATETGALHAVAQAMGKSPRAALDALMREALTLCRPDGNATTGVSLLERDPATGEEVFRWTAMAGRLAHHVGGSTPRDFSPCGVCLDQMRPVLFDRPDHCFTYFQATGVPFLKGLVLPFRVDGEPAGTIWIVSHDSARQFDAEDARLMTSLADFTGAVYSLLRAREIADAAREEREQLLQALSHEWRTPLSAITGLTALVDEGIAGPVTDEQHGLLRRARAAADHLLALVTETLARARSGVGGHARTEGPHLDHFDLGPLVAETTAMVAPAARAAGLAFDTRVGAGPVLVHGDATQVRQILFNLLGNAVKFTEHGRVEIALEGLAGRAPDGLARVVVRDSGIGIAPEHLARVFDRFWRADPSGPGTACARMRDGAGLGLAISRDLARGMGGDLTVESTPCVGSAFTLLLPQA